MSEHPSIKPTRVVIEEPLTDEEIAEKAAKRGGGESAGDEAYEAGASAKLRGEFLSANPYEVGSYAFVSWENGYNEAELAPGGASS